MEAPCYPDESIDKSRFRSIIVARLNLVRGGAIAEARERVREIAKQSEWSKEELADAIKVAVPELAHLERARSLDDKL